MSTRCQNEHIRKNRGRLTQNKFIDKQTITEKKRLGENLIIFNFADSCPTQWEHVRNGNEK